MNAIWWKHLHVKEVAGSKIRSELRRVCISKTVYFWKKSSQKNIITCCTIFHPVLILELRVMNCFRKYIEIYADVLIFGEII